MKSEIRSSVYSKVAALVLAAQSTGRAQSIVESGRVLTLSPGFDHVVMTGSRFGAHVMSFKNSDTNRIVAHWIGYLEAPVADDHAAAIAENRERDRSAALAAPYLALMARA